MEFKLKGWGAIVAIALLGGGIFFTTVAREDQMETQGVKEIQNWILLNQGQTLLPQMEDLMKNPKKNRKKLEELSRQLQPDAIEIIAVKPHGHGEKIVAQVDARVGGNEHRYYLKMRHSLAMGWQVEMETTKFAYWSTLF